MSSETPNHSKRQKTTVQLEDHPSETTKKTPSSQAALCYNITLASLQPTIKPLAEVYVKKFLSLFMELYRFNAQKARFTSDNDFVPASCRIKFALNASTRVKENAPESLSTLITNADLDVSVLQKKLKDHIVTLMDLEIKTVNDQIGNLFCTAAGSLCIALVLESPEVPDIHAPTLLAHVFEVKHNILFKYIPFRDLDTFFQTLKTATNSPDPIHEVGSLDPEAIQLIMPLADKYFELLANLFVRTIDTYRDASKSADRARQTAKFVQLHLKESATVDTSLAMETDTLTKETVVSLISSAVADATRPLQQTIKELKRETKNPKAIRGAPSRARQKNQKDDDKKGKAAGNNNATGKGNSSKSPDKKKKKSKEKKKNGNKSNRK